METQTAARQTHSNPLPNGPIPPPEKEKGDYGNWIGGARKDAWRRAGSGPIRKTGRTERDSKQSPEEQMRATIAKAVYIPDWDALKIFRDGETPIGLIERMNGAGSVVEEIWERVVKIPDARPAVGRRRFSVTFGQVSKSWQRRLCELVKEEIAGRVAPELRGNVKKAVAGAYFYRGQWVIQFAPDPVEMVEKGVVRLRVGERIYKSVLASFAGSVRNPSWCRDGEFPAEKCVYAPEGKLLADGAIEEIVSNANIVRERSREPVVYALKRYYEKNAPAHLWASHDGRAYKLGRIRGDEARPEHLAYFKTLLRPPRLWPFGSDAERVGPPRDMPDLETEKLGEHVVEKFGLHGIEWGHWVTWKERPGTLERTHDALCDLSDLLNVEPAALGLPREDGRRLGLGLGSRGRGGKGAANAHYDPNYHAIALLRFGMAGSLAHEWFHGFDATHDWKIGEELMSAVPESLKKRCAELDKARKKPYWGTPKEIAARTFEAFALAELERRDIESPHLVAFVRPDGWDRLNGTSDMPCSLSTYPYPTGPELERMRDKLVELLRSNGVYRAPERGPDSHSRGADGQAPDRIPRREMTR